MCVSARPAEMARTILYAGRVTIDGTLYHTLGYQNVVQNLAPGGGNMMIIPIPAKPDTLTPDDIYDMSGARHTLTDLVKCAKGPALTLGEAPRSLGARYAVFDRGIYTVVLAYQFTPEVVREALAQVPFERRPTMDLLKDELFALYAQEYPGFPVLLPCFDVRVAAQSEPFFLRYQPDDPDYLYLPALDAHTGDAPRLGQLVDVDHTIVIGADRELLAGFPVFYQDDLSPELTAVLPRTAVSVEVSSEGRPKLQLPNGDFYVHLGGDERELRREGYRKSFRFREDERATA